jgi:nitrogen regulatory protein PII
MPDDLTSYSEYSVLTVVVDSGLGSRVLKAAKGCGINGGTVIPAKGFSGGAILQALDLCERNMEAVILLSEKKLLMCAIPKLDEMFRFAKPHHGFAFSIPVFSLFGIHSQTRPCLCETERIKEMKYRAIFTIVDRGNGESVIDSAKSAGAKGGTIFSGRGSGIHETEKLFSMEIEPEKEVVLIITDADTAEGIVAAVRRDLEIEQPGKGIIFVQPVDQIVGVVGLE